MSSIATPQEHKIQIEVFEGPLDLLLYLIKKNEVDISDIPIAPIADQYMEYLGLMRMLDLNIAGEFLVMAATLMLIKSRMLLPPEERAPGQEEDEEDPRWELVRQLIEYRKFKEAARFLERREIVQENVFFPVVTGTAAAPDDGLRIEEVNLFDLIAALNSALKRLPSEEFALMFADTFSVVDKIEAVLNAVREKKSVSFDDLLEHVVCKTEVVCIFLAILELIRLRQVRVVQQDHFGEILVTLVE